MGHPGLDGEGRGEGEQLGPCPGQALTELTEPNLLPSKTLTIMIKLYLTEGHNRRRAQVFPGACPQAVSPPCQGPRRRSHADSRSPGSPRQTGEPYRSWPPPTPCRRSPGGCYPSSPPRPQGGCALRPDSARGHYQRPASCTLRLELHQYIHHPVSHHNKSFWILFFSIYFFECSHFLT